MADGDAVNFDAVVKTVLFNKDGFAIFKTEDTDTMPSIVVKGAVQSIRAGMRVSVVGTEGYNDKYNSSQISASSIVPVIPASDNKEAADDMFAGSEFAAYLGSGIIPGLGMRLATRLVEHFGRDTERIINDEPLRMSEVAGISETRAVVIHEGWKKGAEIHDIFRFLSAHGLSLAKAAAIHDELGAGCIHEIKKNPYILCKKVDGIGFKTADAAARSLGIGKDSVDRIRHGIAYFFTEEVISGSGSTGADMGFLTVGVSSLLDVSPRLVVTVLQQMIEDESFVCDENGMLFQPGAYEAERRIANSVHRLRRPFENNMEAMARVISRSEEKRGITLSGSQKDAIKFVLSSSFSVLTGQPGTGKTTILQVLLDMMSKHKVALCAPAGKAAKRMEEATGLEASTIHRLLEVDEDGSFLHNASNKLDIDLLIMDESSMADVFITAALLEALPDHCKVFLVGDIHQLPSVGAGRMLGDLIEAGVVPVAELTEIRRQGSGSSIVCAARAVNAGEVPKFTGEDGDFPLYTTEDAEQGMSRVIDLVTRVLPASGVSPDDIQVLSPGKNGSCGTVRLNSELQRALNPNVEIEGKFINILDRKIAIGDRVIQTKNNRELGIYNGDVGRVSSVDSERGELVIDFLGTGKVAIPRQEVGRIDLFYAGTVHKAQGSEFPHVVMPIFTSHYMLLKRNLFYTGITRGRHKVHIVTDPQMKAIGMAVKTEDGNTRVTSLQQHLTKLMPTSKPAAAEPEQESLADAPT